MVLDGTGNGNGTDAHTVETRAAESTGAASPAASSPDEQVRPAPPRRRASVFGEAESKQDLTLKCISLRKQIITALRDVDKTRFIPAIADHLQTQADHGKRKKNLAQLEQEHEAQLEKQLFQGGGTCAENLNKYYVAPARYLVDSQIFNVMILLCIVVAGLCVGIQTYPSMEDNSFLKGLDMFILVVFALECVVKTAAEGSMPWRYYTNEEGPWNIFDESLVVISIIMLASEMGFPVSFLRLLRLLRLLKLLKKVEQLRIIIHGLLHGVRSVVFIFIVMMVIFYMFAVVAVQCFGDNDPAHFGNIAIAMLTLFRCATLEDWTDVMYINMYGCKEYHSGLYTEADRVSYIRTDYGTFARYDCVHDLAQGRPVISVIYFAFFILISSFMMLSLFVGAVCNGMHDAVVELEDEAAERQKELEKQGRHGMHTRLAGSNTEVGKIVAKLKRASSAGMEHIHALGRHNSHGPSDGEHSLSEAQPPVEALTTATGPQRRPSSESGDDGPNDASNESELNLLKSLKSDDPEFERHLVHLMNEAFKATAASRRPYIQQGVTPYHYMWYAGYAKHIRDSKPFFALIILTIVVAGVCVGIETAFDADDTPALYVCNVMVNVIFVCEAVVKIVAQGRTPYKYFFEAWNCLDFTIVVLALIPYFVRVKDKDMLNTIMILRLLRIQKLFNSVSQLRVIIESLVSGMHSLVFVVLILVLFFYVFSILGIVLFGENDPVHFGSLQVAFLSLFRAATCEDWTDIMYINMFGCAEYGYNDDDGECDSSSGSGWLAAFFFVLFVIIGGLVLLSLFIGIICTSMETVTAEAAEHVVIDKKVKNMCTLLDMSMSCRKVLHDVFLLLDTENKGCLDFETISPIFSLLVSVADGVTEAVASSASTDESTDESPVAAPAPPTHKRVPTFHDPDSILSSPLKPAPSHDLLLIAADSGANEEEDKAKTGGAVTPVEDGLELIHMRTEAQNIRHRQPLAVWELELVFLAVDADLSGLIEFDEFLFFAAFVHTVRNDPSIIDDFRAALTTALAAYDREMEQKDGHGHTQEMIDVMNEEVMRLGPEAMKLLIEDLQADNAKLRGKLMMSGHDSHGELEVVKERTKRLLVQAHSQSSLG